MEDDSTKLWAGAHSARRGAGAWERCGCAETGWLSFARQPVSGRAISPRNWGPGTGEAQSVMRRLHDAGWLVYNDEPGSLRPGPAAHEAAL